MAVFAVSVFGAVSVELTDFEDAASEWAQAVMAGASLGRCGGHGFSHFDSPLVDEDI